MIVFPNCKINLGLSITGKREDGYHNIETVFYPLPIMDALEVIHAPARTAEQVSLNHSGILVDGEPQNNLCLRAYELLKEDFPALPLIKLHLHKAIPIGAGLGGGSADAAFTLKLLNEKFSLNLSTGQLLSYALKLGSDCPFFIINRPCAATGRGELLQEIPLSLSGHKLVLVNPGIHVNTGWAFSQLNIKQSEINTTTISQNLPELLLTEPVISWKQFLINDFEAPVFEKYPAVGTIKKILYSKGALYAAMSGSGSTVFGIFERTSPDFIVDFPADYLVRSVLL